MALPAIPAPRCPFLKTALSIAKTSSPAPGRLIELEQRFQPAVTTGHTFPWEGSFPALTEQGSPGLQCPSSEGQGKL